MKQLAQLVDDLLALRRGDIAFEAVTDHVSSHLIRAPHAAEDVLRQIDSAYRDKLLEPGQVARLKTIVADTIAPFNAQLTERIRGDLIEVQADGRRGPARLPARVLSRSNIPLGTQLRERFVLDEVIGSGGMGTVYKGRDLLKVEARDRNPYVAIKVLNEDFRKRHDAFIVLQREASRQQRLAHPNVATVYDFDRTGDLIFISMELLEGVPLDTFLRTESRTGLEWPKAEPYIEGMCAALTYAHEHGIVHADFKPSNCFLMKDGKVKVLDFGIARAMKRPNQAQVDATVYDGASIGALTPAYASAEMLEGTSDPDPRDDIYGLACVCYELLSGKHPFNSLSAREARYQRLVPKRIVTLTAKQNRALQRALAFERAERTPSVREFIQDLRIGAAKQAFWNQKRMSVAAIVLVLVAGAIAWYVIEYPVARTLADVRSNDPQTVQDGIERLATLTPDKRARVTRTAKNEINAHFAQQIQGMLDSGEIDAAYGKAEAILSAGLSIYPDSAELAKLRSDVAQRKERFLSELAEQYETYLAAGRLLKSSEHGDIQGVMQRIRIVDPKHPLLTDPRVPGAFAAAAEAAIAGGKLDRARALLADGAELSPNNRVLRDVADKFASAEQQIASQKRSAELAAKIDAQLVSAATLDQLAGLAPVFAELRQIEPNHPTLLRAAAVARASLGDNFAAIAALMSIDDVLAFDTRYRPTFEALRLDDATARLSSRREALETRRDRLFAEARTLASEPPSKANALADVLQQARLVAPGDPEIAALVTTAVSAYRRESQRLSDTGKWKDARAALSAAQTVDASPAAQSQLALDMERLQQRQQDSERESVLAEREAAQAAERARIANAEGQLRATLAQFSATPAQLDIVAKQIAVLSALDPGNAALQSARASAAQRVTTAAKDLAQSGRFDAAFALLSKAGSTLPGAPEITEARTHIEGMQAAAAQLVRERAVVAAHQAFRSLTESPQPTDPRWQREAEAAIAALRKVSGNEATAQAARGELANVYLKATDQLIAEKRFTVASQMLEKAEQLGPRTAAMDSRRAEWARAYERDKSERTAAEAKAKLDATKQRFNNEIKLGSLDRARRTLTELQALAPADSFIVNDAPKSLANAYVSAGQARLNAGDFASAWRFAASGAALARDDAPFDQLRGATDAAANRRMESLLGTPASLNENELTSLAKLYRSQAPESYQAHSANWQARSKAQLAKLTADPASYNRYLRAVQTAFEDASTLQAMQPLAVRPASVAQTTTPTATAAPQTSTVAVTTSLAPAPTVTATPNATVEQRQPQQAPASTTAAEPNLMGKWCGEGISMTFASNEYSFDLGGGRTVKYPVSQYQRAGTTITMSWSDKNLGSMVTEFSDFSTDGQAMTQVRGKTATAPQWQTYNRKFKKCN